MSIRINNTTISYPGAFVPTGSRVSNSYFVKANSVFYDYIIAKSSATPYYVFLNGTTLKNSYVSNEDAFVNTTVATGVTYHIVTTFNNGVFSLYVNGFLKGTFNTSQQYLAPNNQGIFFGSSVGDFEVSDYAMWQGHVLTQAQITVLRNKTSGIYDIARSNLTWYMTFDGPVGNSANALSSGVASRGNITSTPTFGAGGSVTFTDNLVYTPDVFVDYARIGPSSGTLLVGIRGVNNNPLNVASIASHPSITINGSETMQLANPIWATYLPYVMYPITGLSLNKSDTIVMNTNDGWISSSTSSSPAIVNQSVDTSYMGGTFLPSLPTGNKTMKMGYNVAGCDYYGNVCFFSNLVLQGDPLWQTNSPTNDANGNLTAIGSGPATRAIARANQANGYDNNGFPSIMTGIYRLEWSGAGDCSLYDLDQFENTITFMSSGIMNGNQHTKFKQYLIKPPVNLEPYNIDLALRAVSAPIYYPNLYHIHNSGIKWDRRVLNQLSGAKVLRGMDWFMTNSSNHVFPADYDARDTDSARSVRYYRGNTYNIVSISGYNDSVGYFMPNYTLKMTIETNTAHGLEDGNVVDILIPKVDVLPSASISVYMTSQVKKISNTKFAVAYYENGPVMSGYQIPAGATMTYQGLFTAGWNEFMEYCNYLGAEPWICIPHAAQDALVQRIASGTLSRLPNDTDIHVEYTNEHWNYGPGFHQAYYCYGKGKENGNISATQWYTKRAGEIHTLFRNIYNQSGRADNVKRVFASQCGNLAVTTTMVNYAYSNSIGMDELAIAPYYGITPDSSSLNAAYNMLDPERLLDVTEMSIQKDVIHLGNGEAAPYSTYISGHKSVLVNKYPNAKLINYEGGMEIATSRYTTLTAAQNAVRSQQWSRYPRIKGVVEHMMQKCQDNGVDIWAYYRHAGSYGSTNGVYPFVWSVYTSPYTEPGLGDGTDGKFNNKTSINNLTKLVSPIGAAIQRWQELYDAWNQESVVPVDTINMSDGFYIIFQPSKGNDIYQRNGVFIIGTPDEELFGTYFVQGKRKPIERPDNY